MKIETYQVKCRKCNKITEHFVIKTSRKRGVLLKCGECWTTRSRYTNLTKLNAKAGGTLENENTN